MDLDKFQQPTLAITTPLLPLQLAVGEYTCRIF